MDSFDRQVLQLNIDTCRSIVKCLNKMKGSVELGDTSSSHKTQRDCVHRTRYEEAWDLR